ncbi:MAG: hypothetical protein WAK55_14490 [Xanthobacteraceae bacterium]
MKVEPKLITKEVELTVEKILDTWPREMKALPLPLEVQKAIINRWQQMALVEKIRPQMVQGFRPPSHDRSESAEDMHDKGDRKSGAPRKLSSG